MCGIGADGDHLYVGGRRGGVGLVRIENWGEVSEMSMVDLVGGVDRMGWS